MATRYTSLGTAALIAGSIGASVYTASTAQSAREAISAAHDPTTRHGELAVRVDAGGADVTALAAVDPGTTGQVLTVGDAGIPVWRDPAAGGETVTTYYADDGTASVGGAGTAASVTGGADDASTITLTVPASPATATTTSSAENGPRWCSPEIAQSVSRVALYLRSTSVTGFATGGWRWSSATLRRSAETPPANLYLGASWSDNSAWYAGNLRAGSNSGTYNLGVLASTSPTEGADRWLRVTWYVEDGVLRASLATGATTGASRPTLWTARTLLSQEQPSTMVLLGSAGTGALVVCVGLETFGSAGGESTAVYSVAVEVTS